MSIRQITVIGGVCALLVFASLSLDRIVYSGVNAKAPVRQPNTEDSPGGRANFMLRA